MWRWPRPQGLCPSSYPDIIDHEFDLGFYLFFSNTRTVFYHTWFSVFILFSPFYLKLCLTLTARAGLAPQDGCSLPILRAALGSLRSWAPAPLSHGRQVWEQRSLNTRVFGARTASGPQLQPAVCKAGVRWPEGTLRAWAKSGLEQAPFQPPSRCQKRRAHQHSSRPQSDLQDLQRTPAASSLKPHVPRTRAGRPGSSGCDTPAGVTLSCGAGNMPPCGRGGESETPPQPWHL